LNGTALSQNKTSSGRIIFLLLSGGFNLSPDPRQSNHFTRSSRVVSFSDEVDVSFANFPGWRHVRGGSPPPGSPCPRRSPSRLSTYSRRPHPRTRPLAHPAGVLL